MNTADGRSPVDLVGDSSPASVSITGQTRVVALIGHPVGHSLSPVIHNAGFRSTGLDYAYVAFDVQPGSAEAALQALRVLNISGFSVTMPHKSDVARGVDVLVESARKLDSVNTVEVGDQGKLIGHSTDGDGLVASMAFCDIDVRDRSLAVFGAGAAGRSIVDALARHGAHAVHIVNRTLEEAQRAAELASGRADAFDMSNSDVMRSVIDSSDIVINATSVGMGGSSTGEPNVSEMPFDPSMLAPRHVVVDLVYHPIATPLLRAASARGCEIVDGLGMLIHQAALQQVIWTGEHPDVREMTQAALRALH